MMEHSKKTMLGVTDADGNAAPIRRLIIQSVITYSPDTIDNFENVDPHSLTVPDMAMSLQEIMEKFTQGGTLLGHDPVYYDDEFPDISKMDYFDLQQMMEDNQSELSVIKAELERRAAEPTIEVFEKETPRATEVTEADAPADPKKQ